MNENDESLLTSYHEPLAVEAADQPELRFPWPPDENQDVLAAAYETWRWCAFSPSTFFRAMPARPIRSALSYYIPIGVLIVGFGLFWSAVFAFFGLHDLMWIEEWSPTDHLIEFLLSPLWLPGVLLLSAALVHTSLRILGAAQQPFAATARVLAFAYGVQLVAFVPLLGGFIGKCWMLVLAVIGLREAHHTSTARSVFALVLPLLTLAIIFALILVAALVAGLGINIGDLYR